MVEIINGVECGRNSIGTQQSNERGINFRTGKNQIYFPALETFSTLQSIVQFKFICSFNNNNCDNFINSFINEEYIKYYAGSFSRQGRRGYNKLI